MNKSKLVLAAILTLTIVWFACASACTPKREAAAEDLAARDAQCAVSNLDRSPEQMLTDCAIPHDAKSVQDIIDMFVGAQKAAVKVGAVLPRASAGDAGAGSGKAR